jgi:hypothetical protein
MFFVFLRRLVNVWPQILQNYHIKFFFIIINMGVYKCSIFAYSKTVENFQHN